MNTRLRIIKISARVALGLVWFYEGLVPKILFVRADELELVRRWSIWWATPELTLQVLGLLQITVGVWLTVGWKERAAVSLATVWMGGLIFLVAAGNRSMLTDPYGALIKDLCLIACAIAVWVLAPMTAASGSGALQRMSGKLKPDGFKLCRGE